MERGDRLRHECCTLLLTSRKREGHCRASFPPVPSVHVQTTWRDGYASLILASSRRRSTVAIGTIATQRLDSFLPPGFTSVWRALFKHFSHKCICVPPVMLSKKASRTRLEIDPEPDLMLEFDEAAELLELLRVLVAAEG